MLKLSFNPEVRLGDLLATVGVISGVAFAYANVKAELSILKEAQVAQIATNGTIRQEIREVSTDIKTDIREMRQEMRRTGRSM